jgi:hypothetical protein
MAEKVMVIVPRTAPALYAYLKGKFAEDPTISVIQDRRSGERRRRNDPPAAERRRDDRRRADEAHAIVVKEP